LTVLATAAAWHEITEEDDDLADKVSDLFLGMMGERGVATHFEDITHLYNALSSIYFTCQCSLD
jgi:hypothetical protein